MYQMIKIKANADLHNLKVKAEATPLRHFADTGLNF